MTSIPLKRGEKIVVQELVGVDVEGVGRVENYTVLYWVEMVTEFEEGGGELYGGL